MATKQQEDLRKPVSPVQRRPNNPRRPSSNSVTLRHHRLARDASLRASPGSAAENDSGNGRSPRQNSSGDSHETSASDPKKWFDQSNQNPTATFDSNTMDVDPPFFQRESGESSNDDPASLLYPNRPNLLGHSAAHSSSADDYRSVIDDLTVEIHKLKEELKHYKQQGPDMLRKDKLFEIKVHGLPRRKKRELEATLRDFAAGLDGSPKSSSRNVSRRANGQSASGSKHASSSSGSNARPVDSAYASMSTGANSSGTSLGRQSARNAAKASEQKVENYLRDIPEGLYPRHMVMTDKERKKIVVRRLEQLFTGKIRGRSKQQNPTESPVNPNSTAVVVPVMTETIPPPPTFDAKIQPAQKTIHQPPNLSSEAAREAQILPSHRQSGRSGKKSGSRDNGSSNSNGDQTESAGNGNGSRSGNGNSSGSGTNTSPPERLASEQRPTRPKDLDPDRAQVPSENMAYIKHLGLVPPELLPDTPNNADDVSPDAEGWVYLNLLCNLAQLHMINVTPSFVRSAVSEISTKFQLSPDGRKIRWRGGTEGTRLSSDSSADNYENSPETDRTNNTSAGKRKRQKTGRSTDDSGISSKNNSKFGPQISTSSDSFHYKPLFVRQGSSNGAASMDDTLSSFGPVEDSNVDDSRWGQSGSGGTSNRRKRRHDGAIIYYSGAPFCTDLSGDPGDTSPATYMMSSGQDATEISTESGNRRLPFRTNSGSSLSFRPLSSPPRLLVDSKMDIDSEEDSPGLTSDAGDVASDIDIGFPWSDGQQYLDVHPLEPCGLGGVLPDDHFMVVVTTKRTKEDSSSCPQTLRLSDVTDNIINRLASMSTSSPAPVTSRKSSVADETAAGVQIEYQSGRIKRLNPVPLPPPAIFFPPFSSDSSGSEMDDIMLAGDDDSDFEDSSSQELISRRANPHQSDGYPDGHLSSGDEDGEDLDDEDDERRMIDIGDVESGLVMNTLERGPRQSIGSAVAAPGTARNSSRSMSVGVEVMPPNGGSSAATAGKAGSDADSSSKSS